jgi:hypothetical protein
MPSVIILSVAIYYAECRYAECHNDECHYAKCRGPILSSFEDVGSLGEVSPTFNTHSICERNSFCAHSMSCQLYGLNRPLLAVYVGNVATEAWINSLIKSGVLPSIRHFEVFAFAAVSSTLMYLYRPIRSDKVCCKHLMFGKTTRSFQIQIIDLKM